MATTFQYKIKSLKTNPNDDNYITEANVEIFGTEGSVIKSNSCHCVFPGNKADVGDNFKSIEDLMKAEGEAVIVGWAKSGWGEAKCKKLENMVQYAIDTHNGKSVVNELESKDTSYTASPTVTPNPNSGPE